MDKLPLVSLCIPTYNGADFVQQMLHSVKKLQYSNLEIVISDDGSKDETLDFIYSAQLPKCKVFSHERYGLVNNWNYCIKQSSGKYIKFLFQDDTLEPECITKLVEVAEKDEEIGLVFSPRHIIYEQPAAPKNSIENLHTAWSNLQPVQNGISLLQDPQLLKHPHNKIGEPTNVLIRKSIFEEIGLFDPDFKQYPDLEMWLRIMSRYKVAWVNQTLASFRIHASQTTNYNVRQAQSWLEIYRVWLKIIVAPIYQTVPFSIRQQIKVELIKQLIREYIKSFLFGRWERWSKINELVRLTYTNPSN